MIFLLTKFLYLNEDCSCNYKTNWNAFITKKMKKKIQIEGGRLGSIVFQVVKILFPKNEYS